MVAGAVRAVVAACAVHGSGSEHSLAKDDPECVLVAVPGSGSGAEDDAAGGGGSVQGVGVGAGETGAACAGDAPGGGLVGGSCCSVPYQASAYRCAEEHRAVLHARVCSYRKVSTKVRVYHPYS